jgi:N-formylglutamate amidohydrolase
MSETEIHEPELDPPFEILTPRALTAPLVFSSPHSGNIYPKKFLSSAKLDSVMLRRSEDAFVDELFQGVVALGAPLLRARFPRAYLDVNREPYELDPRMFDGRLPVYANTRSLRVAGGLGTIARVVGEAQEIYAGKLPIEEAMARIDKIYKPYHRSLRTLLEEAQRCFGLALLIDCHSMPASSTAGLTQTATASASRPDFVVGDRYGASCAAYMIETVESELRTLGYAVQRNKPYAGGFITEFYGNPANRCYAMQIEVSRPLYMDEKTLNKNRRFDQVAADLTKVAESLALAVIHHSNSGQAAAE